MHKYLSIAGAYMYFFLFSIFVFNFTVSFTFECVSKTSLKTNLHFVGLTFYHSIK